MARLPRTHFGSMRLSQGLLVGSQHGMMRTPRLEVASLLQHRLIVLTQPGSGLLTHPVWDALSPHQHEHLLALRLDSAHPATAENLWFYVVQGQEQS